MCGLAGGGGGAGGLQSAAYLSLGGQVMTGVQNARMTHISVNHKSKAQDCDFH